MGEGNGKNRIRLLPPALRDQIAAGEVVERPASVLKELLENSLDAGADELVINIEDGGQSCISVHDNGRGIHSSELELAVTSHATSKIRSFTDLMRIDSYGFRGEALPSIASVSKLRVSSFYTGENKTGVEDASFIEVHYGTVSACGPTAISGGTLIEVRELFSNVPARLKFLKSNSTELKRCQDILVRMALAHTGISFVFNAGEREVYRFTQGENLLNRLEQIWPRQVTAELLPFELVRNGIKIHGLAGRPGAAQNRADRMLFYVNGRAVNDRLLQRATREAYKGRLLAREYPQIVLFLEIDPEEIDVNVHPAKSEVRFRDERSVFSAVLRAVGTAFSEEELDFGMTVELPGAAPLPVQSAISFMPELGAKNTEPESNHIPRPQGFWGELDKPSIIRRFHEAASSEEFSRQQVMTDALPASMHTSVAETGAGGYDSDNFFGTILSEDSSNLETPRVYEKLTPAESGGRVEHPARMAGAELPGGLHYVGQVAGTYLVVMQNDKLILLDQHAVHERVLMERFSREAESGQSQLLALPLELSLHQAESERLQEIWAFLGRLGFILATSGAALLQVKGIPPLFDRSEARDFLRDALADKNNGMDELLHMMACKGAIKAGQSLSRDEALGLLSQWLYTPERGYCPHGRPTAITLGAEELEKMFKRRG